MNFQAGLRVFPLLIAELQSIIFPISSLFICFLSNMGFLILKLLYSCISGITCNPLFIVFIFVFRIWGILGRTEELCPALWSGKHRAVLLGLCCVEIGPEPP